MILHSISCNNTYCFWKIPLYICERVRVKRQIIPQSYYENFDFMTLPHTHKNAMGTPGIPGPHWEPLLYMLNLKRLRLFPLATWGPHCKAPAVYSTCSLSHGHGGCNGTPIHTTKVQKACQLSGKTETHFSSKLPTFITLGNQLLYLYICLPPFNPFSYIATRIFYSLRKSDHTLSSQRGSSFKSFVADF